MQPCLHQVNFTHVEAGRFIALAQRSGFSAVELHPLEGPEPPSALEQALVDSTLRVVTANPLPGWFQAPSDRISDSAVALIDAAVRTGAEWVVAPSPVYIPTAEPRPTHEQIAASLARLLVATKAAGVGLAFEPVGLSIKRPGGVGAIGSVQESLRLLELVSPDIKLVLDSFCLGSSEHGLSQRPWPPAERVAAVQLADWDGERLVRRLPGEGRLSLTGFVTELVAHGYDCPLSLEVFPLDVPDVESFALKSAQLLAELLGLGEKRAC